MREPQTPPVKAIRAESLDPHTLQLVREAGQGRLRLTVVEDNGQQIAEVGPVEPGHEADLWSGYDPDAARRAWQASAGVLREVNVEALLADLKAEREQDSPGRPAS